MLMSCAGADGDQTAIHMAHTFMLHSASTGLQSMYSSNLPDGGPSSDAGLRAASSVSGHSGDARADERAT